MAVTKFWVELVENSYSVENNSSNVTMKVKITTDSASYNETSPSGTIKWGGLWAGSANTSFTHGFKRNTTTTLYSGTWDVTHNADGTGKVSADVSFNTGISAGTVTASKTLTLTPIPRTATITDAPNFTDADSPTIAYTNPLGDKVSEVAACISSNTTSADICAYRSIDKTGTSYTFTFTSAEKTKLQQLCANAKSATVYFYVRTYYNGTYYYSKLAKTLTISGASDGPTLNPTVKDVNSTTTSLTGNASTRFVRGYSNVQFSVGATATSGATIVSQSVTCGSQTSTAASGTFNAVESAEFVFTATDSRGYTSTKTITGTLVDYIPLTCIAQTSVPTADGKLTITVKGNFFNGSFGSKSNSLTVKYRLNNGSWTTVSATKSGNTYSASATKTGLDYQTAYTVDVQVTDSVNTSGITVSCPTVRAMPVFDWGTDSFTHNTNVYFGVNGKGQSEIYGPLPNGSGYVANLQTVNENGNCVIGWGNYDRGSGNTNIYAGGNINLTTDNGGIYINSRQFGENKVLWSGTNQMTGSVTLSEAVSKQPYGIVLVWSAASGTTATNGNFHFTFVPKHFATLGGYSMNCPMFSSKFGSMASKCVYVKDTQITGHSDNSYTWDGTEYDVTNNAFALRYVIGV